jgi:glycerophosphoryl diester phosphodiesterase
MRNSLRALKAMVAAGAVLILAMVVAGAALILAAPAAHADPLDDIVIAHRAGATSRYGEGTLASYKHSVANHADILDGDIHWTKDSPKDSDKLGSILVIHDATLGRITNCKGKVSSWLWTSIRDKCRTDVGKQRLIRLKDLVRYAKSVRKPLAIQFKQRTITKAQAKQLWKTIKYSNVQLEAASYAMPALNKVKKLDAADRRHKINYALVTAGSGGWPSVSKVKRVGTYLHAELSIPASRMRTYKRAGIKVFLWTGKNKSHYRKMARLEPYGVVVNDVAKFQAWRKSQI